MWWRPSSKFLYRFSVAQLQSGSLVGTTRTCWEELRVRKCVKLSELATSLRERIAGPSECPDSSVITFPTPGRNVAPFRFPSRQLRFQPWSTGLSTSSSATTFPSQSAGWSLVLTRSSRLQSAQPASMDHLDQTVTLRYSLSHPPPPRPRSLVISDRFVWWWRRWTQLQLRWRFLWRRSPTSS